MTNDTRALRRDERADVKAKSTDRNSWMSYVGPDMLKIADDCLERINKSAKRTRSLNYTQRYIGLTDGSKPDNFVLFLPLKSRPSQESEPALATTQPPVASGGRWRAVAVGERLGHSSIRTTVDVYAHALRGQDDDAARRWDEFQRRGAGDSLQRKVQ